MPKYRKVTKTTVSRVLRAMAEQSDAEKKKDKDGFSQIYAEELNVLLDNLLNEDFFGTEGQLDPRGDHRD